MGFVRYQIIRVWQVWDEATLWKRPFLVICLAWGTWSWLHQIPFLRASSQESILPQWENGWVHCVVSPNRSKWQKFILKVWFLGAVWHARIRRTHLDEKAAFTEKMSSRSVSQADPGHPLPQNRPDQLRALAVLKISRSQAVCGGHFCTGRQ